MKKIALIFFCACKALTGFAQDESYRGGIADGHALVSQVSAFGNPTSFQPYFGGIGDGYTTDSSINFPQYALINMFSPYQGNTSDGYAADSILAFPQYAYIKMFQPYGGGQSDGWTGFPVFGVTIVPVNLLSFTGEQADKKHLLHWITSQEQNTSHFDVTRSADGMHFIKLGTVAAAGNSSVQRHYDYTDAAPMQGNNFYRLQMFDADGSFKYSNVILLRLSGNATMSIYPNPAAKTLNVLLGGVTDNSTVNAAIFDVNGKLVNTMQVKKTGTAISFDVGHLPAGMYMLRVIWNNETSVWRFVKE